MELEWLWPATAALDRLMLPHNVLQTSPVADACIDRSWTSRGAPAWTRAKVVFSRYLLAGRAKLFTEGQ